VCLSKLILASVKQALATHNLAPSLDFDHDINFNISKRERISIADKNYTQFRNNPLQKSNLSNWEKLYEDFEKKIEQKKDSEQGENIELTYESAANKISEEAVEGEVFMDEKQKATFQIHNNYIFKQVKSGMMIVDQQAAHERILYEKYLRHLEEKSGASQQSLFPQTLEMNISDFTLVRELKGEIRALGFIFEEFGKNSIVITGVPADIAPGNEKELFEGLIEQFKHYKSKLSLPQKENLARAIAKRSGIKNGQKLTLEEMNTLIDKLFACSVPNYTPDGQLVFYVLDLGKIANFFNR